MKRWLIALALLAAAVAAAVVFVLRTLEPPPPLALPEPGLRLGSVTLVEPGFGRRADVFVSIEGSEIAQIGPGRADPDDPFAGAFVLPGLNDLHVHFPPPSLPGQTELWSFLLLLHGVTGVRDPGDVDGSSTGPAIEGIRAGRFPGPRIRSCGYFLDGPEPMWGNSLVATTPEEGRAAVQRIAEEGFDCVKAYNGLTREVLDAVREAAHAEALPVIGHVPRDVPFEQALLDDSQHLIGVRAPRPGERPFPFNQVHWAEVDDARIDFVIEQSLTHDLAHTPTLVTTERLAALRSYEKLLTEPDARLLPRFYRAVVWHPEGGLSPAGGMGPADFDAMDRALEAKLRTVKRMHDAGVRLHSGTDAMVSFIVPGASLHRELRLFVRAGLSPEEALAISTRSSAEFLEEPGLGRLRPGAPAELTLFREDPTRSLDALDTLVGVVREGRLYPREELEAQMQRYREHFESERYDALVTPLVRRVLASTVGD